MLRRVTCTPSSTLSQVVCDQTIKSLSGSEPPASTLPSNICSGSGFGLVLLIAAGQRGSAGPGHWLLCADVKKKPWNQFLTFLSRLLWKAFVSWSCWRRSSSSSVRTALWLWMLRSHHDHNDLYLIIDEAVHVSLYLEKLLDENVWESFHLSEPPAAGRSSPVAGCRCWTVSSQMFLPAASDGLQVLVSHSAHFVH